MPDIDHPTLDAALRLATGTRGYLDYQDALNRRVRAQFVEVLRPAGRDGERAALMVANLLDAGKFATAAELKVRETERLARVGRATGEVTFSGTAVRFNTQATRAARRAIELARESRERLGEGRLAELRQAGGDELGRAFDDAREALTQHLVKFNISADDFEETHKIWDEAARRGIEGGADGALAHVEESLQRFVELRGEEDRGTRPHSPLPWWKYVLIGAILAASVFAVIACFIWSGCSWVWSALGLVAPWVFGIIDRGC